MIRKIIQIDEEKCNGCGDCAEACQEGAIGMVNGKAKLLRDDYCDGLGNCLPACPAGAISFVEREAAAYDEEAVMREKAKTMQKKEGTGFCACPGSRLKSILRTESQSSQTKDSTASIPQSCLSQWPVQIKLLPVNAPYFNGADLLIAADCTAYAYGNFHTQFIKGRITLVGCPKLDAVDYTEKLSEIFRINDIRSVTLVRMEVPCCGGLEAAVKNARQNSGKAFPIRIVVISTDGKILEQRTED